MENFFSRYKNPLVLMAVLFIQVIALATQVRSRGASSEEPLLIRKWTVTAVSPVERALISTGHFIRDTWHSYVDLRNVRKQNGELQDELGRVRLENARLKTDVDQNRRLQALLDFKEKYVGETIAAQVIGSGGSEQSHIIYIDKHKGIKPGMPVITPDGIVGKIKEVYPTSSQVLLISDRESGAGVILDNSRLQGILRGSDMGELQVDDIMSDEKVDVGERVITSGGDRVYPKGLPVGTVTKVSQENDSGPFLSIRVKPAADLNRLEEVLVVTTVTEESPSVTASETPRRAADILAQRLPSIPKATPTPSAKTAAKALAPMGIPKSGDGSALPPTVLRSPGTIQVNPATIQRKKSAGAAATPFVGTASRPELANRPAPVETPPAASPSATPVPSPQAETQPEKPPR